MASQSISGAGSRIVHLESYPDKQPVISVNGGVITPPCGYPTDGKYPGYHIVVLDRTGKFTRWNRYYPMYYPAEPTGPAWETWPDAACEAMVSDLGQFTAGGPYVLIVATGRGDENGMPNPELQAIFQKFGASNKLDIWVNGNVYGVTSGPDQIAYGLIGLSDEAEGIEGFVDPRTPGSDPGPSVTLNSP